MTFALHAYILATAALFIVYCVDAVYHISRGQAAGRLAFACVGLEVIITMAVMLFCAWQT